MHGRISKIILLTVLAALICVVSVFLISNRNTVSSLLFLGKYSSEELEDNIRENNSALSSAMNSYGLDTIRDLTEEENEQLKKGEITPEQAVDLILAPAAEAHATEAPVTEAPAAVTDSGAPDTTETETSVVKAVPAETSADTETTERAETSASAVSDNTSADTSAETESNPVVQTITDAQLKEQLTSYIKRLYAVKLEYILEVEQLEESARSDFAALPESERTDENKRKIVTGYIDTLIKKEKECDNIVDEIVEEIRTFSNENGLDDSICDLIKKYYSEEKALKKASYMKKYL